ncbi:MAG TPA: response regulator [Candidatus Omnitrophota bacterium]|nr:response regulator [Candidatus Omnitrophota bacterium]HPS20205.1 response regulator [Candidatus Omnitrophota bacterium]
MNAKKQVVIADDNKELCELVKDILEDRGYEVAMAGDGYELLAYLAEHNPLVIILDLMMPHKDGMAVFNSVRQLVPYAHIIIYTGYEEFSGSIYARKADRFLLKGADIEELITAVDELCGNDVS